MPLLDSFRHALGAGLEALAVRIQHGDLRPVLARAIQRGKAAEADVQKLSEIVARVAVGLSQSGFPLDPGEDLGRAATRVALNRANLVKQNREHIAHVNARIAYPDDCPFCFDPDSVVLADGSGRGSQPSGAEPAPREPGP